MIDYLTAEQTVAGSILIDAAACLTEVRSKCSAEDFHDSRCRAVYAATCALDDAGERVDAVTVADKARRDGAEMLTVAYCRELMDITITAAFGEHHAEIVHRNGQMRRIGELGTELMTRADDPGENPIDLATEAAARLTDIATSGSAAEILDEDGMAKRFYEQLSEAYKGNLSLIKTGLPTLDNLLGGLHKGGLYILAARPSVGKTAFGLALADMLSKKTKVLFASYEMTTEELYARVISADTGIQYSAFATPKEEHAQKIVAAQDERRKTRNLNVIEANGKTVAQLGAIAKRDGASILFVDYLGLIQSDNPRATEYERITAASLALKQLASRLHIPVVALCQLNRESAGATDPRPKLHQLRSSGAIEQDADAVMLLHRPDYLNDPEERTGGIEAQDFEVIVAKNRHGMTGTTTLKFYAGCNRFRDVFEVDGKKSCVDLWR